MRDVRERGRELDQVLDQYTNLVKPAFEEFTLPVRCRIVCVCVCVVCGVCVILCLFPRQRNMLIS